MLKKQAGARDGWTANLAWRVSSLFPLVQLKPPG